MEQHKLINQSHKSYNQIYSITKKYLKDLRKILKENQLKFPDIRASFIRVINKEIDVFIEFEHESV